LVGVAVNVVLLPAQMLNEGVVIFTDGVTDDVVVIVRVLLVAVGVLAQDALLVITTVTTSPLAIVDVVNVALLVPTLAPFIFH
jgi:hypothetical protein